MICLITSCDGEPVSMSMDDILNGLNGDCHQRLEAFIDYVSSNGVSLW